MIENLPVGGTTGLSHEHNVAVEEAAAYLATVPRSERPRPLVPALKAMFGISALEVCEAIRLAERMRFGGAHV